MKEKQACRGHGRPRRFRRFAAGGLVLICLVLPAGCTPGGADVSTPPTPSADQEPPVILGARDLEVEAGGTISYRRGVTVTDNSGVPPELTIDSSRVNLAVPGVYPVTYTARDGSGNESSVTITVTVEEAACPC